MKKLHDMKKLTVFTPKYNRAYILPKLYESLSKEPVDLFIWLIVDDGSRDNTKDLVAEWQLDGKVEIVYYRQPNGGKMRAHNKGVELCTTALFVCIDSDDQIVNGAVKNILNASKKLLEDTTLCGIIAKKFMINSPSSTSLPNLNRSTLHNLYNKGFNGETTLVFKTSVIGSFPFPEIEGEKFVTEGYVYDQIDQKYEYLIMDEFLMQCEYQEDGYTVNSNSLFMKYPKGWALYFSQYYRLYAKTLRDKVKYMGYYISMCLLAKKSFLQIIIKSPSIPFCLLSIPVGLMFSYRFNSNRS